MEDRTRQHSYFEDGPDPEELLVLPDTIMRTLKRLNEIHHTGMIIFEALPKHLKIHSYYRLLDPPAGAGVSGFAQSYARCRQSNRGTGRVGVHEDAVQGHSFFYPFRATAGILLPQRSKRVS